MEGETLLKEQEKVATVEAAAAKKETKAEDDAAGASNEDEVTLGEARRSQVSSLCLAQDSSIKNFEKFWYSPVRLALLEPRAPYRALQFARSRS